MLIGLGGGHNLGAEITCVQWPVLKRNESTACAVFLESAGRLQEANLDC